MKFKLEQENPNRCLILVESCAFVRYLFSVLNFLNGFGVPCTYHVVAKTPYASKGLLLLTIPSSV